MDVIAGTKHASTFPIAPASFGAPPLCNSVPVRRAVPFGACQPLQNGASIAGKYVLVSRGGCTFPAKARMIQEFGGIGMILINDAEAVFPMSAGAMPPQDIILSAVMIGSTDAMQLVELLEVHSRLHPPCHTSYCMVLERYEAFQSHLTCIHVCTVMLCCVVLQGPKDVTVRLVASGDCISEELRLHIGIGTLNTLRVSEHMKTTPSKAKLAEWSKVVILASGCVYHTRCNAHICSTLLCIDSVHRVLILAYSLLPSTLSCPLSPCILLSLTFSSH